MTCCGAPAAEARAGGARKRKGVGFSFFFHGAGFTGSGEEQLKARVLAGWMGAEDGRVLGVLGQLGADETYDGKVGGHIRRGLDAVTQLFGAVQVAEAEVARARERGGGEGGGEEDEEDEELFKLKRERARLAKELADIEGGSRT